MPQARGVDWGIVSTLVAAETPGLSVKKVETTGAYKDKEELLKNGQAGHLQRQQNHLGRGQGRSCSHLGI